MPAYRAGLLAFGPELPSDMLILERKGWVTSTADNTWYMLEDETESESTHDLSLLLHVFGHASTL